MIDFGLKKRLRYDARAGMMRLAKAWVSKASAVQREGRTGRTCPGTVVRMYSSQRFENEFPDHDEPEMTMVGRGAVVCVSPEGWVAWVCPAPCTCLKLKCFHPAVPGINQHDFHNPLPLW